MRNPVILCSSFLTTLAVVSLAPANTYYVSPTGTGSAGCTKSDPCSLDTANNSATAGDTVTLMDGTYKQQLVVKGAGTSSAWLTFQADDCATPIIEGTGIEQSTGEASIDQPTGVGSATSTYVRFVGIVSRGWNTGFGNGWTGTDTTTSNGNWEFKYCIADGNGRTGFTFFSAAGIHIQNSIASHNGMSTNHSWSSGITLYEAQGSSNLIEGSISFENMDGQKHTDGSGFIADEYSHNSSFINNIAFRNAGSCLRLTKVTGTKFLNNTCYHNAMDTSDSGPPDPSELYFTNDGTTNTTTGISFMNNVLVATGTGPGAKVIGSSGYAQPTSGWSNNITATGTVSNYFTSSDGTNPDFTPGSSLAGKGGSGGPSTDIGFDPKCITKGSVSVLGTYTKGSWWQYSVDLDYIKSIGGVQKCFNPKSRSGNDVGAYASGTITKATPCQPSTGGSASTTGGASGAGGAATGGKAGSTGGANATGGSGAITTGGSKATTTGGAPTTSAGGGTKATGGAGNPGGGTTQKASTGTGVVIIGAGGSSGGNNTGGVYSSSPGVGGVTSAPTSTNPVGSTGGSGGTPNSNIGGVVSSVGGAVSPSSTAGNDTSVTNNSGNSTQSGGCGCRVAGQSNRSNTLAGVALLGFALLRSMRRRKAS